MYQYDEIMKTHVGKASWSWLKADLQCSSDLAITVAIYDYQQALDAMGFITSDTIHG